MTDQERISTSPEKSHDREALQEARLEQQERIGERLKEAGERSPESSIEQARAKAIEVSSSKHEIAADAERQPSPAARRAPASKIEREASFKKTMNEVQSQMTPSSRAFSKVIHNKTVEKVSETTGATIARPNALLSGAIFAFLLTLAVYLVAKNIGYPLSGFESIGAFIIGWVIGLAYDFIKIMISGKR